MQKTSFCFPVSSLNLFFIGTILHSLPQNSYTFVIMVVLIPHPAEALVMSHAQKQIITGLCRQGTPWYPVYPLWIVFGNDFQISKPSDLKGNVVSLVSGMPECRDRKLVFPFTLALKDGRSFKGSVTAAEAQEPGSGTAPCTSGFPLQCKVFRAAEAEMEKHEGISTWKACTSCWVKAE